MVERSNGTARIAAVRRHPGLAALAAIAVLAGLARLSLFAVDTTEHAVVTAFGDPVQVIAEPGLRFKWPYQQVTRFDKRLFSYTPSQNEFLTLEKTAVAASAVIFWRIADARKFFETVFDRAGAGSRLDDILFAELGGAIGRNPLTAFVSATEEEYRAEAILAEVTATMRTIALRDYGIEIADVQLQRFDFPERNRLRVYARMVSERGRISMKHRSEGEEEGLKIRAAADEEKARILAEAYKIAEQHRGQGDAEAARIYAEALEAAPEFYRFLRSMEAAQKVVEPDTTLLLPADSALFGLLHDSDYYHRPSKPGMAKQTEEEVTSSDVSE